MTYNQHEVLSNEVSYIGVSNGFCFKILRTSGAILLYGLEL